jgi:hypothetical protein
VNIHLATDIVEFLYKPFDVDFMWRSYAELPAPNFIQTIANPHGSSIGFYGGGWQQRIPKAGTNCVYKKPRWASMARFACCPGLVKSKGMTQRRGRRLLRTLGSHSFLH